MDPPDLTNARLDFSQFHDLWHWPFTPHCRSQYGGWRNHLTLTWEYRRRDQVLKPWHWLRCRTGHHRITEFHQRTAVGEPWSTASRCLHCRAKD